jgi:hypothetical protein
MYLEVAQDTLVQPHIHAISLPPLIRAVEGRGVNFSQVGVGVVARGDSRYAWTRIKVRYTQHVSFLTVVHVYPLLYLHECNDFCTA